MKNGKPYKSVLGMVRDLSDDPTFTAVIEKKLAESQIVRRLSVLRVAANMSQKDLAEKLGWSQSRVSKLEASTDSDLTIGDFAKYASAVGYRVGISLDSAAGTPVSRIKTRAFEIKREVDRLASLVGDDHELAEGVARFFGEAMFNLVKVLQGAAGKLPCNPEDGSPYVSFQVHEQETKQEPLATPRSDKQRATKKRPGKLAPT